MNLNRLFFVQKKIDFLWNLRGMAKVGTSGVVSNLYLYIKKISSFKQKKVLQLETSHVTCFQIVQYLGMLR